MSAKQLHGMFKGGGIALGLFVSYQVLMNDNDFRSNELNAISVFAAFNEFLFFYFFDTLFKEEKAIMKKRNIVRVVICFGILFYLTPLFVPDDYKKSIYAAMACLKLVVGLPFVRKLKLETIAD